MLQSAIYADLQAPSYLSPSFALLGLPSARSQKSSFARFSAWGRALLTRSELDNLNSHLLRDIGLAEHRGD
jgi:hypothetical protein